MRSSTCYNRYSTRGLSLIELMVSIALGIILTLGIVNMYLESKRNYVAEEDTARIQENGRFALNLIKRELLQVGFYGGKLTVPQMASGSVTAGFDCVASGDWALDPSESLDLINDFNGSGLTTALGKTLSCLSASEIKANTDVFSVKRTAGEPTVKDGIYADGATAANDNQWYLKIKNYGDEKLWVYIPSGGDFPSGDINSPGGGTKVDYWEVYSQIFFIRNYSIVATDGIPTLCVARLAAGGALGKMETQCLIEGVEDMQLEFGIDTDNDGIPNQFQSDPSASDIANAVVARFYLLLRGTNTIAGYTNAKRYQLGQKAILAKNDAYLRRVMTTTVQMRNATMPAL